MLFTTLQDRNRKNSSDIVGDLTRQAMDYYNAHQDEGGIVGVQLSVVPADSGPSSAEKSMLFCTLEIIQCQTVSWFPVAIEVVGRTVSYKNPHQLAPHELWGDCDETWRAQLLDGMWTEAEVATYFPTRPTCLQYATALYNSDSAKLREQHGNAPIFTSKASYEPRRAAFLTMMAVKVFKKS